LYGVAEHLIMMRGYTVAPVDSHTRDLTPLHVAALVNDIRLVKLIGSRCTTQQINACCAFGTALSIACRAGNLTIVDYLLQKGASMLCNDEQLDTALHHAARHGRLSVVKRLVEIGGLQLVQLNNMKRLRADQVAHAANHENVEHWLLNWMSASHDFIY
jgi:ankyrin repeat protein